LFHLIFIDLQNRGVISAASCITPYETGSPRGTCVVRNDIEIYYCLYFSFATPVSTPYHLKPVSYSLENALPFSGDIKAKTAPVHTMKPCRGEMEIKLPSFLTLTLDRGEW